MNKERLATFIPAKRTAMSELTLQYNVEYVRFEGSELKVKHVSHYMGRTLWIVIEDLPWDSKQSRWSNNFFFCMDITRSALVDVNQLDRLEITDPQEFFLLLAARHRYRQATAIAYQADRLHIYLLGGGMVTVADFISFIFRHQF